MTARAPQDMVHTQQLFFWQHFRANRLKGNPAAGRPGARAAVQEAEVQSGAEALTFMDEK